MLYLFRPRKWNNRYIYKESILPLLSSFSSLPLPPITLHKLNNLYTIYQAVTEEKANELIARP